MTGKKINLWHVVYEPFTPFLHAILGRGDAGSGDGVPRTLRRPYIQRQDPDLLTFHKWGGGNTQEVSTQVPRHLHAHQAHLHRGGTLPSSHHSHQA